MLTVADLEDNKREIANQINKISKAGSHNLIVTDNLENILETDKINEPLTEIVDFYYENDTGSLKLP